MTDRKFLIYVRTNSPEAEQVSSHVMLTARFMLIYYFDKSKTVSLCVESSSIVAETSLHHLRVPAELFIV